MIDGQLLPFFDAGLFAEIPGFERRSYTLRILDRQFHGITWVLVALMAVSLFLFQGAFTMPLLLIYAALNALRYRREIGAVLRRATPGQKAAALLAFAAAVAASFLLIWYGGRLLQDQGAAPVFVYVWIALVIVGAILLLRSAAVRLGFFGRHEEKQG